MDKRKMKKLIKFELVKELLDNRKNIHGESKQELMMSYIGIYDPSSAQEKRFKEVVEELWQEQYNLLMK